MKILARNLKEALEKGNPIATKTLLPILGCACFTKSRPNSLTINVTNLESYFQVELECEDAFDFATPLKPLLDFVAGIDKDSMIEILEEPEGKVTVKSGSDYGQFDDFGAADYPVSPQTDFQKLSKIVILSGKGAELKQAFSGLYAASRDDSRFNLDGLLLDMENSVVVATDGHRLTSRKSNLLYVYPSDSLFPKNVILPKSEVVNLLKIFKKSEWITIEFVGGKNDEADEPKCHVIFSDGVVSVCIRCKDGDYPEYKNVINDNVYHTFTVDKMKVLSFLKTLETDRFDKKVIFKTNGDKLVISYPNKNRVTEISAEFRDEHTVSFNKDYLVDLLKNIDEFKVYRESSEGSPCYIYSKHGLDLLMPMVD